MEIRFARPDDLPRVREILETVIGNLSIYPEAARQRSLSGYTLPKLRQIVTAMPNVIFVALDGGRIEGVGIAYLDRGTYFVDWICVDPTARNRWIGPRLYHFALATGRRLGAPKTWGAVIAENRSVLRYMPIIGGRVLATLRNHWYGLDWVYWEHVYADQPEHTRLAQRITAVMHDTKLQD